MRAYVFGAQNVVALSKRRLVQDSVVCMAPLNSKTRTLRKGERRVYSFRRTGLVAELALQKSKSVCVAALRPEHLPASVTLYLDGLANREAQVLEENRVWRREWLEAFERSRANTAPRCKRPESTNAT